jgi:hypothetical protein
MRKDLLIRYTPAILIVLPVLFLIVSMNPAEAPRRKKSTDEQAFQSISAPSIPEKVSFAGEAVPLHNFDVYESLDREMMVNAFFHSQTLRLLKLLPRYFAIIEPILKEQQIPDDFKYLAVADSGLNERALSPAGAAGIWQFMKAAAQENGLEMNNEVDERYHLEKSTLAACRYLRKAYDRYGNWTTVAASYNAGMAGINRQINRQNQPNYFDLLLNEETSRYVFRIIALKLILEAPKEYGFFVEKNETYPSIPFKWVEVKGKVESFADFAAQHGTNYKLLKMFNPWLRDTLLNNKEGKTYQIKIPVGEHRQYVNPSVLNN